VCYLLSETYCCTLGIWPRASNIKNKNKKMQGCRDAKGGTKVCVCVCVCVGRVYGEEKNGEEKN